MILSATQKDIERVAEILADVARVVAERDAAVAENVALRKGHQTLCAKIESIKPLLQRVAGNRRFMQVAGPCREALNILGRE